MDRKAKIGYGTVPKPSPIATPSVWHHPEGNVTAVAPLRGGVYNQGNEGTCYAHAVAQILVEASLRVYGRPPLNTRVIIDSLVKIYGTDGANTQLALEKACDLTLEKYGWVYNVRQIQPTTGGDHTLTLARPFLACFSITTSQWAYFSEFFAKGVAARKKVILAKLPTPGLGEDAGHAVMVIGQGTASVEGPYWKIRNSWGSDFADCGDFRVSKDLMEKISVQFMEVSWNEADLSPERRKKFTSDLAAGKSAAVEHQQRYFSSTYVYPWTTKSERVPKLPKAPQVIATGTKLHK